jgi:aminoglycoside phosphotransferase (APT) family kinase protein
VGAQDDNGTAEEVPDGARPRTSTRDPEDLQRRLEAWLATRLPEGSEPAVPELAVPETNGMSSETLLFDAEWRNGTGPRRRALVARLAPEPSAVPVFPTYDLERQFRVMREVAARTPVPVPTVLWSEPDPGPVGAPFFVMERVDGDVPPDVLPYNFGDSWLFDASAGEQQRLQEASVGVLAELHAVAGAEDVFGFLAEGGSTAESALRRHVDEQWAYYRWAMDGLRLPVLERAFAWLEDHWPDDPGPTVLSWGDSRIGNVMYRDFSPVAVLDWEMAALGPRELDLAWMVFLHCFFEDIAARYGLPGMPTFLQRDDVATSYEARTGHSPRHLDWHFVYAALRHGVIMARVQRRSIHFGEAAMPEDPDDLVMHRSSLEAMLDGSYWGRR